MSGQRITEFERCGLASGLLNQDQLDEVRLALRESEAASTARPSSPFEERLADQLVDRGYLNRWQAKQLLEGRTKFNLGPYWMVDSIGRGGMGQVFKAHHEVLQRVVAVKVLPRSKSTPEAVSNFMHEIRHLAKLDHPNLVRALDAGEDGNVYYLVTEYVPGKDLRKLVRRKGRLSMEAAAGVVSQVAAGLQHAHQTGLIHRDVKPGNVLVTPDGHAKLSDLGLAGPVWGDAETDPRFGKVVGTADYLSPDHIMAPWTPVPAWDIYSLGCTLYYAVTGKVPFPGGTTGEKVRAHCELQPLDPRRLNPEVTEEFLEVIAAMMAKDPAQRLQTGDAVAARLAPWTGIPVSISLGDDEGENSSELFAGTPAPVGQGPVSPRGGSDDPDSSQLKDTVAAFPEIPETGPNQKEGSSETSQATQPVGTADEETAPLVTIDAPSPPKPLPFFHPLVVLVLFPFAVVGLVMVISWIVGLLE
ncbi:MAG: serine/threonine-protein kinase [Planctomycetota bacterium]